ncbi:MAG: hypothetical protein ACE37K_15245 [Planctomycetota bacterium]
MTGGIDWDTLAARVTAAAKGAAGAEVLRSQLPALADGLLSVRAHPWVLAPWGISRNFDENARCRIVEPGVLRAIALLARQPMPTRACHAGLLHTYGYLLSTIETPYGRKRDRWVRPAIERGLGLRDALRPMPRDGSLLHNVTWFLARIAWSDEPRQLRRLARERGGVAASVLDYDYAGLAVTRVSERVRLADRRLVELHSELVAFPDRQRRAPSTLLVYWYRTTAAGRRLMTAFPVFDDVVDALLAQGSGDGRVDVRPRYNAVVDGFDAPRRGRCDVTTRTA